MRWASLGPQFDWTRRIYDDGAAHRPLPPSLELLARRTAGLVQQLTHLHTGAHSPQACRAYQPDAALVNYYYEGDTLGGHCDDVEPDLAQPIVAASLGCDAVFLMGGPTRDTAPTPLLLRSGDVVVLGGSARNCFHGVPRVFTDRPLPFGPEALDALPHSLLYELSAYVTQHFPAELLEEALSPQQGASVLQQNHIEVQKKSAAGCVNPSTSSPNSQPTETDPESRGKGGSKGEEANTAGTHVCKAKEILLPVLQHMQSCRINISVRAVR